jgi:hypothetical protein
MADEQANDAPVACADEGNRRENDPFEERDYLLGLILVGDLAVDVRGATPPSQLRDEYVASLGQDQLLRLPRVRPADPSVKEQNRITRAMALVVHMDAVNVCVVAHSTCPR